MNVIVTDTGFGSDDWTHDYITLDHLAANRDSAVVAVDLASDTDPAQLVQLIDGVDMVRIDFPSFADGRGFTLARRQRQQGYEGRLRAKGHVISEQYTMARRSGFDEVEISDELAARQPWELWQTRANWQENDYQARVRGSA